MELPPALVAVEHRPGAAGLFLDYDGTLAPIVRRPDEADPAPGVRETLSRLGRRLGRVVVISGRPTEFLAGRLGPPPGVELAGLYGMERSGADGAVELAPAVVEWLPVVEEVRRKAEASAPPTIRVEAKRVSVTLHWREHPESEQWARAFVEQAVSSTALVAQPGRMALELRPPIELDKGTVVRELGSGLAAVSYFGDDLGDLPAFAALDELEDLGAEVARVAVADAESAPAVLDAADLVLAGPAAAVSVLEHLAAAAEGNRERSGPQG